MKKIRFSQPKYAIPLIILPFLVGINWGLLDILPAEATPKNAAETLNEINPRIPEANLDKKGLKDKFESFKDAYKHRRDFSAINELEDDHDHLINDESKYSEEEKQLIDSVNNAILTGKRSDFMSEVKKRTQYTQPKGTVVKANTRNKTYKQNMQTQEQEMQLFKQQLLMLDSLAKTPEQRQAEEFEKQQKAHVAALKEQENSRKKNLVPVSKSNNYHENYFNTVAKDVDDQFIKAILDENLKVIKGSRIRIRILEDIYVGEELLKKGTYLFANITSFSEQRISISIKSILVEGQIKPVELVVYDNDGMEGLYVPASKFRDFTKGLGGDMASGSNFSIDGNSPNNLSELFYGLTEKGIQSTSRAAANASRKNRAKLKYGSIIYLVNPDQLINNSL